MLGVCNSSKIEIKTEEAVRKSTVILATHMRTACKVLIAIQEKITRPMKNSLGSTTGKAKTNRLLNIKPDRMTMLCLPVSQALIKRARATTSR
jgi:hypothetical protein